MNAKDKNTLKSISLVAALAGLLAAGGVQAGGHYGHGGNTEVLYQSRSANHAIPGYPSSVPAEVSAQPQMVYVSQAYGPAIYSYPHVGTDQAVPLAFEYTDTAYGQAIHSYDRVKVEGEVKVLPLITH